MDWALNAISRRGYVDTGSLIGSRHLVREAVSDLILESHGRGLFNSSSFSTKLERAYLAMHELRDIGGHGTAQARNGRSPMDSGSNSGVNSNSGVGTIFLPKHIFFETAVAVAM